MKKLLALPLAVMMALAPLVPAKAVQQTLSAGPFFGGDAAYRIDQQLQKADQNFGELYTRVGDVPLSYCGWFPGESNAASATNTVEQGAFRKLCYLPRGATFIRLMMSNTAANSSTGENDMPTGMLVNLGVETNVAPPWNATTAYAAGTTVTYGSLAYTALAASTGVQPGVLSTATWQTLALPVPKPVTCGGVRTCGLPLQATASGTSIPPGYFVTDPFPVNVPATGGWIAVDMFTNQAAVSGAVNTINTGPITIPFSGEYANFGSAQGDNTLTGGYSFGPVNPIPAPIVIGQPAAPGPSACLVTDSIDAGVQGQGLLYQSGTLTGGTGFVASDVGRVGYASSTNNGAAVVNTNARVMISGVSGGAITYSQIDNGSYSNAVSAGPYTLTFPGAAGSGASVSSFGTGTAHDNLGPNGTEGALERALSDNGIPFVAFSRAGDLLSAWQTRDYTRLANVRASGCSTAVIELGINDLFGGASAATILSRAQALATQLRGLGTIKSVILMTLTPAGTSSSDGYLTQGAQTVNGGFNAVEAAYNAAVRAVPSWANGYLDANACVTTVPDGGVWKTDGVTVGLSTIDGTHPSATGHAAKEACEAPLIKALLASKAIQ